MTMMNAADSITIQSAGPIVMVDDSSDDFYIAELMYQRSELTNEFVHCESGDALMAFLGGIVAGGEPHPALILMDLNMPGMDGIQTTKLIRSHGEFSTVPVVAMLTSSIETRDRERAEAVGANAYFSKPLDPTDYIELFNSFQA